MDFPFREYKPLLPGPGGSWPKLVGIISLPLHNLVTPTSSTLALERIHPSIEADCHDTQPYPASSPELSVCTSRSPNSFRLQQRLPRVTALDFPSLESDII